MTSTHQQRRRPPLRDIQVLGLPLHDVHDVREIGLREVDVCEMELVELLQQVDQKRFWVGVCTAVLDREGGNSHGCVVGADLCCYCLGDLEEEPAAVGDAASVVV